MDMSEVQKVAYLEMQQHMAQLQHQQHMNKTLQHYIPAMKVSQVQVITSNGPHLLDNHLGTHHLMDHTGAIQNFTMMQTEEAMRPIAAWAPDYSAAVPPVPQQVVPSPFMGHPNPNVHNNAQSQHTQTNFPNDLTDQQNKVITQSPQKNNNHHNNNNNNNKPRNDNGKTFTCTECGKGLARKDKLVIHMRIHTGEKPYICEICKKAFARRDKLVIHMTKLKHITPSNLAPLGKRSITIAPASSSTPDAKKPNNNQSNNGNQNNIGGAPRKVDPKPVLPTPSQQLWRCETCGASLPSREELLVHSRSHIEASSVIAPPPPPPAPANPFSWAPTHTTPQYPLNTLNTLNAPQQQHFCLMCRQEFPDRTEFMFHLRTHFKTDQMNNSLDMARLCT